MHATVKGNLSFVMPDDPIDPPPRLPSSYVAPQGPAQTPSVVDRLIPGKNPPALIGYYVAVFSLIPCIGLIIGPTAIVLGYLGLRAIKQQPHLPGSGHAWTAIVLGSITTVANLALVLWGLTNGGLKF